MSPYTRPPGEPTWTDRQLAYVQGLEANVAALRAECARLRQQIADGTPPLGPATNVGRCRQAMATSRPRRRKWPRWFAVARCPLFTDQMVGTDDGQRTTNKG